MAKALEMVLSSPKVQELSMTPTKPTYPYPEKIAGVYFLAESESLVYIGKTGDSLSVVPRHRPLKKFDRALFVPVVSEEDLSLLEQACIVTFRPHYNAEIWCGRLSFREAFVRASEFLGIPVDQEWLTNPVTLVRGFRLI
jgi:hypothetical protein